MVGLLEMSRPALAYRACVVGGGRRGAAAGAWGSWMVSLAMGDMVR